MGQRAADRAAVRHQLDAVGLMAIFCRHCEGEIDGAVVRMAPDPLSPDLAEYHVRCAALAIPPPEPSPLTLEERQVRALESIAASLVKLANPLVAVGPDDEVTMPGSPEYEKHEAWKRDISRNVFRAWDGM